MGIGRWRGSYRLFISTSDEFESLSLSCHSNFDDWETDDSEYIFNSLKRIQLNRSDGVSILNVSI